MPRPRPVKPAPRFPELDQLNAIRLRNDWSIRELRNAMHDAGVRVSSRTLQYLITPTSSNDRHIPTDRTLYKIRVYLAHQAGATRDRAHAAAMRAATGL